DGRNCLDSSGGRDVLVYPCYDESAHNMNQVWQIRAARLLWEGRDGGGQICIDSRKIHEKVNPPQGEYRLVTCAPKPGQRLQRLEEDQDGTFLLKDQDDGRCLSALSGNVLGLSECTPQQRWRLRTQGGASQVQHVLSANCIDAGSEHKPILYPCHTGHVNQPQKFSFIANPGWIQNPITWGDNGRRRTFETCLDRLPTQQQNIAVLDCADTRSSGVRWELLNAFVPLERQLWDAADKPPPDTPVLGGDKASRASESESQQMVAMKGMHAVHWLTAAAACSLVSNRLVSAARTADVEPFLTGQVTAEATEVNWADTIWRASSILWTLDLIWFLSSLVLSAAVICWSPTWLVPTRDEVADKEVMSWFTICHMFFLSLTSHAAGILGFVGFQTIVMTRIVAASKPRSLWDISDFLLYTSIAISLVAVCASFVFLVVDYLRRLAIASARMQGMRLILNGQKLEHTGLGRALMSLSIALLVLYFGVLYTETNKKDVADDLLLQRVLSCVTVVLYYVNLSSLCESPKVQFHQTSGGSVTEENQFESISLKDFLLRVGDSDGGSNNNCRWSRLTAFLHHLAGEDLALFLKEGRRRAFFPHQRLAPLAHVVFILLLLGLLPGICQLLTERLFEDPDILDMKAVSAALIPSFRQASRRVSLCCGRSDQKCEHHPLKHSLMQFDEEPALLEIPTNVPANCTLSVEGLSLYARSKLHLRVQMMEEYKLCSCLEGSCECCHGFRGEFSVGDKLIVNSTCTPALCDVPHSNRNSGPDCACEEGFVGEINWHGPHVHGHCRPAPCDVHNAVSRADRHCVCEDGYSGTVSWNGRKFEGTCMPAPCNIANSNGGLGRSCRCKRGFQGNISWHGPVPRGSCMPATCDIENSDLQPGRQCRCKGGYVGTIRWNGSVAHGSCEPATCAVMHSNEQPGEACACKDGFSGNITWQDSTAHGTCSRAKCQGIPHATEHEDEGGTCRCRDGFAGEIVWRGSTPHGICSPAPCLVTDSNLLSGKRCACMPGFHGDIKWSKNISFGSCVPKLCQGQDSNGIAGPKCSCKDGFRKLSPFFDADRQPGFAAEYSYSRHFKRLLVRKRSQALDTMTATSRSSPSVQHLRCAPAACKIRNSNRLPGNACSCKDGYTGSIRWKASLAKGSCKPAPCNVRNSNMRSGPSCRCADGFQGKVEWNGSLPMGRCFPAACRVRNSDFAPGPACGCAEGFFGKITWQGSRAAGQCRPRPLCAPEITFATLLETDLTTASGNSCSRGTMMFVRGFVCNQEDRAIQWTAARAESASLCNLTFGEGTRCGIAPHFPQLALPTSCSVRLAQPRCSSKIVYRSAMSEEVQHCYQAVHGAEYVEWHGTKCGYDLIQWNSRPRLAEPPSDLCEVKNRSLGCGEPAEGLPRACQAFAEPAVFVLDLAADLADLKPLLKIFDSGVFTLVHRELNGSDTTTGTWQTDGEYLSLQWVASTQSDRRMAFRCYHSDSSIFTNRFGWRAMTAAWQPPPWWSWKFRTTADFTGIFNTDRLCGCKVAWSMAGTCYRAVFGEEVTQTLGDPDCSSQNTTGPGQTRYAYISSMFAVQTYRSRVPCSTTAAYDELKLEVVDVRVEEPYADVSHTPCRTSIRYFVDATSLKFKCESLYRGEYYNGPADIASVWPFDAAVVAPG
ncbi:jag1a, partial [Symbiodinium sp. KB8]